MKRNRGRQAIELHNLNVTSGLNPPFLDLLFSLFKLINQRHGLRKKYHQNSFISKTIETDPLLRNLKGKHKIFCKTVKQQQQIFYHLCDEIEKVWKVLWFVRKIKYKEILTRTRTKRIIY